jgi:hypothetical protein
MPTAHNRARNPRLARGGNGLHQHLPHAPGYTCDNYSWKFGHLAPHCLQPFNQYLCGKKALVAGKSNQA